MIPHTFAHFLNRKLGIKNANPAICPNGLHNIRIRAFQSLLFILNWAKMYHFRHFAHLVYITQNSASCQHRSAQVANAGAYKPSTQKRTNYQRRSANCQHRSAQIANAEVQAASAGKCPLPHIVDLLSLNALFLHNVES